MKNNPPRIPENLNPYTREVLEQLGRSKAAESFILGGGVALSHYHPYRQTVDLDGWWKREKDESTVAEIRAILSKIAARDGLSLQARTWGETMSLELSKEGKKIFSTQISVRTHALDTPCASPWGHLPIETLRDNLASKMTALVERGAPRDFLDIQTVCDAGLTTSAECWTFYAEKHGLDPLQMNDAKAKVLTNLAKIEKFRPLHTIENASQRQQTRKICNWYKQELCKSHGCKMGL